MSQGTQRPAGAAPLRFESRAPMMLGGLRRRYEFAETGEAIQRQWREFLALAELPGETGGPVRYGVMCGADSTGFEYMCAVEVESLTVLPEGIGRLRVPAQRYAVFEHDPRRSLRDTWESILNWLAGGDYDSAHTPDFEVYPALPDPDAVAEGVEIWVGVTPRTDRTLVTQVLRDDATPSAPIGS